MLYFDLQVNEFPTCCQKCRDKIMRGLEKPRVYHFYFKTKTEATDFELILENYRLEKSEDYQTELVERYGEELPEHDENSLYFSALVHEHDENSRYFSD